MTFECQYCNYTTDDKRNWNKHNMTDKHKLNMKKSKSEQYKSFFCKSCNYKTQDKSNWLRHIKSEKHHQEDVIISDGNDVQNKKIVCKYCNGEFKRNYNLMRHLDKCIGSQAETTIKDLQERIESLEEDKHHYRIISENAGQVAQKSVNAMNYLITNKYEPELLVQYDPNILQGNKTDEQFMDLLINKFVYYNLAQFIGDALIAYYKKDDPKEQALWNSDSSRLNYIIRDVDENGGNRWVVDKNANKVRKLLLSPLLIKIRNIVVSYLATKHSDEELNDRLTLSEIMERRSRCFEITQQLKNKELENDIIEYITPPLYLDRKTTHKSTPK